MPRAGTFNLSHMAYYIYDFCTLPYPYVGLSILVCHGDHTYFHLGLCGRKFVLCLFGQCPGICTIYHRWQHTCLLHLSLQVDGMVAFEDIPVLAYAAQPAMILRCISLSCFFSGTVDDLGWKCNHFELCGREFIPNH